MKTYQYLWRLILYKPWLYLLNVVLWTLHYVWRIVPGLIISEFFDTLSGGSALGLNVWTLSALLVAAGVGQIVIFYAGMIADVPIASG
jgi:ATP-binding cassette subfamily B protein